VYGHGVIAGKSIEMGTLGDNDMNKLLRVAASTTVAVVLAAGTAQASAAQMISAKNVDGILNIARGYGSAVLQKDGDGDPFIVGRMDGTKYSISFYGCRHGRDCDDIQFASGWEGANVTLERINRWNRTRRFAKAYLDRSGDPVLEMSVNLDNGVSTANLDDTFAWWQRILKEFNEKVRR